MKLSALDSVSPDGVTLAFTEGRFAEVEECCKLVLAQAPETPWAWHFLGRLPTLDSDSALDFLGTALSLSPDNVQILCDLSRVCARAAQFELAVERAEQALAIQPNSTPALISLAEAHTLAGRADAAWSLWERAVTLAPSSVPAQIAYASGLQERERFKDAVKHLKRATSLAPQNLEAWFLLGKCLAKNNQPKPAVEAFEHAKQINPKEAWVWFEGAKAWAVLGNNAQAEAWNNEAIACDESEGLFFVERGRYLCLKKEFEAAILAFNQALKLGCSTATLYALKAQAMVHFNRTDQAIACYAEAVKRDSKNANYLGNLAGMCLQMGILSPALEAFDTILASDPSYLPAMINKAKLLKDAGRAAECIELLDKTLDLSERNSGVKYDYVGSFDPLWANYLYSLLFVPGLTAQRIFERHQVWGRKMAGTGSSVFRHRPKDHAGRQKLRIGYLSADLRQHSVTSFIGKVFENHDPSAFEIYAYSATASPDGISNRIKSQVAVWRDVSRTTASDTAKLIFDDQLDILVELSGHTLGNRLEVCARKPAPIQVTYLGYPATTGLKTIDYRLTDVWADPIGQTDSWHTEKLVRIPDCGWCYQPMFNEGTYAATPPCDQNGHVTFGCFNNLSKLNEPLCALWIEILRQVPDSRLYLKAKTFLDPEVLADWMGRFTRAGIAQERLHLMAHKNATKDHLAVYNEVDIALDAFPYHGTTTTCEALAAGVPVVSLAGEAHVSRVGVSLLTAVGLSDLVASTPADYIAVAVKLAAESERLRQLRGELRNRMQQSVLGDAVGFTRKLETCYQQMVANYRAGTT